VLWQNCVGGTKRTNRKRDDIKDPHKTQEKEQMYVHVC
jgi:hypothetical protein